VMDALERSSFPAELTGQVFLSQDEAFSTLLKLSDTPLPPGSPDSWLARGLI
jgi:sulfate permease, SulP family